MGDRSDQDFVRKLERYCTILYDGGGDRKEAQEFVLGLDSVPDIANKCRYTLEVSQNGYAQFIAANTLTTVISQPMSPLSRGEKLDLKVYTLQYLREIDNLTPYVVTELCKLIGRITKLCWFDESEPGVFPFRNVMAEAAPFIMNNSDSIEIRSRGVQQLHVLVCEMNQPDNINGLAKHRKVCSSFRDEVLFEIFQLSLDELSKIIDAQQTDDDSVMLLGWVLQLCRSCLSYDFIGTCTDETTDELKKVQIPGSWREVIMSPNLLPTFFQLYLNLTGELASSVLSCLVYLASVRRTLFSDAQRADYMAQLVSGVIEILLVKHELKDNDNYHEFCRLLARLKTNYNLSELVELEAYPQALELISEFTLISLDNWEFAANSMHYLLGLWDRLAGSTQYLKADVNHGLSNYTPTIFEAYVKSRLQSVQLVLENALEDPLEDAATLASQMKQIASIARCNYDVSAEFLINTIQDVSSPYLQLTQQGSNSVDFMLYEGQMTWLVLIAGAVIGARTTPISDLEDEVDAMVIAEVLVVMQSMEDSRPDSQVAGEQINSALLRFLDHLRRDYIGEQRTKCKKLQGALESRLSLPDELALLDMLMQKLFSNLRWCTQSAKIVRNTISLFSDYCTPFNVARKLISTDSIQYILENHGEDTLPFLTQVEDTKHRTAFYRAVGKLINHDFTAEDRRFESFMAPFANTADEIMRRYDDQGDGVRHDNDARAAVLGFARDIRGLLQSCITKPSYALIFDWIFPDRTPVLVRGAQIWHDDPLISIPCIKTMSELAYSRNSRLVFGSSSPNGILLFREITQTVLGYGNALLQQQPPPPEAVYPHKYKGILACFHALKMTMSGDYVNFGVFKLYQDPCLDDVMGLFFRMLESVPIDDLNDFPKLSKAYFSLMLYITRDHASYFATLSVESFRFLLLTLQQGVRSVVSTISINSCAGLDSLLTYVYSNIPKVKHPEEADVIMSLLQESQDILLGLMSDMFQILVHESCKNQWSMSRPLLPLILFNPDHFDMVQRQLVDGAAPNRKDMINEAYNKLMDGVESSLIVSNRDIFTQRVCAFRRTLTSNDNTTE